jgi:hypothetical protein
MRLGVAMACLRIGMVTSTRSTSHHCIFLILICDVVIFAFPLFWGFVCDYLQSLHPNDILPRAFVVLKLWMIIFSSNQTCLEHVIAISYSPQKYLFNNVLHVPIEDLSNLNKQ